MKSKLIKVTVAGRMSTGTPALRTMVVACNLKQINEGRHYDAAMEAFEHFTEGKACLAIDELDDYNILSLPCDYDQINLIKP